MTNENESYNKPLGEFLRNRELVTPEQLELALSVQAKTGMRLGSVLMNMGILSPDNLLDYLAKRTSSPGLDLYKLNISPEVLRIISFEIIRKHQVLPVAVGENSVFMAMVTPDDDATLRTLRSMLGKNVEPIVVPESQMKLAIEYLEAHNGRLNRPLSGLDLERMDKERTLSIHSFELLKIIHCLVSEEASDLLFVAGVPPSLKKYNEVFRLDMPSLTPEMIREFAYELMTTEQIEEFNESHDIDFAYTLHSLGRFRVNVYLQRGSVALTVRKIPDVIPSWETLGLPEWLGDFALRRQGLILITGPSGQGKTTTLVSLVDRINARRKCNIITVEDPIEFLHKHQLSNISQREVGSDTLTYDFGLKQIFRQAPDVIVIGELRDVGSVEIAVRGAETGHLVLATFHSTTTTSAIERLIDFAPSHRQNQMRVQLADNMLLTVNLRLLPHRSGSGRVLALESLVNSHRIRSLIRDGKTHQIRSMYQQSTEDFVSMDVSLVRLVRMGKISPEDARAYCDDRNFLDHLLAKG